MLPELVKDLSDRGQRGALFARNLMSFVDPTFSGRLQSAVLDSLHDGVDVDIKTHIQGEMPEGYLEHGFRCNDMEDGGSVLEYELPGMTPRKVTYLPDVAEAAMPAFMAASEANLMSLADASPSTEVGRRLKLESLVRDCGMGAAPKSEVFEKCTIASALVGTRMFCREWFSDHTDRFSESENGLSDDSLDFVMGRMVGKEWWPCYGSGNDSPMFDSRQKGSGQPFPTMAEDLAMGTLSTDSISGLPMKANPVATYLRSYAPDEFVDAWRGAGTEGERLKLEAAAIMCVARSADAYRFPACKGMTTERMGDIDLTLADGRSALELTGAFERDGTSKIAPGFSLAARFDRDEADFMRREDVEQRLWDQFQSGLVLDYDTSGSYDPKHAINSVSKRGCHIPRGGFWEISRHPERDTGEGSRYSMHMVFDDCMRGSIDLSSAHGDCVLAPSVQTYFARERDLASRQAIYAPSFDARQTQLHAYGPEM